MKAQRSYFILLISAIIIFGSLISWYTYRNAKNDTATSLIARTDTIAQLVDEKAVASLSFSDADLQNPEYQKLKKQFMAARSVNPDVRFIYIFAKEGNTIKFVVDSEPEDSEGYSPPGEEYPEAQKEIYDIFANGKSIVQGVNTDSYGTWVTGMSAIRDKEGNPAYVVGIDIEASNYIMKPYIEAAFPSMLSLLLLVLASAAYLIRKKELELVKTKAQFVSVASHELRSPLTGIRWSAENLLTNQSVTGDMRVIVNAIHDSSVHLLTIINDLLSISTAEHLFIDKKSFEVLDVNQLVETSISDLSSTAVSNGVTIEYDSGNRGMKVKGNAERLKNLISNLVSNAIKYSRKNSVVSVSIGPHSSFKRKTVRIAVRDSGIGIPKDDTKKILQGFYRSENAKSHTVNGTGLGLYICSKIAQLHGGSLSIDSIEGEGTMVIVSLPFYEE